MAWGGTETGSPYNWTFGPCWQGCGNYPSGPKERQQFLRFHLLLPLCILSPYPSFYTRTSSLFSSFPSKMMTPLETFSIMSITHTHTLLKSHCILSGIANNNFTDIFSKKTVTSWGYEPHNIFHFICSLVHIAVPVNNSTTGKRLYFIYSQKVEALRVECFVQWFVVKVLEVQILNSVGTGALPWFQDCWVRSLKVCCPRTCFSIN